MKSYAVRETFEPYHIKTYELATSLVRKASDTWGNELRCHELARAAANVLSVFGHSLQYVDGSLDGIEHTWLVFQPFQGSHILDVYTPGRVPQVQLIAQHFAVARQYKPGERRGDIDADIIQKLYDQMRV